MSFNTEFSIKRILNRHLPSSPLPPSPFPLLSTLPPPPHSSLTDMQQYQQLQDPSLQQLTAAIHSLHSLLTTQDSPLYTGIQACMQREFSTMMQQ